MTKQHKLVLSITLSVTLALLITGCDFGGGSAGIDNGDAVKYYNTGRDLYAKKQYAAAVTEFGKALKLKPDYAEAYVGRGNARYQILLHTVLPSREKLDAIEADTAAMLTDYEQAIKLNSEYAEAYVGRAQAKIYSNNLKRVQQGKFNMPAADYDQPLADLDHAIALKSDYAEAFVARARAHFAKSLAISLASLDASTAGGVVPSSSNDQQAAQEENRKAIADCDQAIKLKPDYADAYATRADMNRNDSEGKEADYTKAIELDPTNPDYYDKRANMAYGTQKYDDAIRDYNRAVELDPDNPVRYYNRGRLYEQKGNNDKALPDYEQALKLGYTDPTFLRSLAMLYFRKSMYKEAIPHFTAYIENIGGAVSDPTSKALNYLTMGGYQLELPEVYYNRGVSYKETGERDKAITDFRKTVALVKERHLENMYEMPGSSFPDLLGSATARLRELGVEP